MSQPEVTQTEEDGALGVLPPSSGDLLAVAGVCSLGTEDAPATFGRVAPLVAAMGVGPAVEAAARHIETTGNPVVIVRTGQTTPGAYGTIDDSGVTGTATVTATAATEPLDDYEVKVRIVAGGTLGVTGITYQTSLDGGRNWGPVTALGVGLVIAIAGSGVSFDIDTGMTLVAGDTWSVRTTAPAPNATELGTAIDALKNSQVSWEILHIAAPIDGTIFDTVETKFTSLFSAKKYRAWVGNSRMPDEDETEAEFLTAMGTIFGAKATKVGELCAAACKLVSSVSGRTYRRPVSFAVASLEAAAKRHINIANVKRGPIVGCSISDSNGNPDEHDETVNPGLDDLRFTVLRSWEGRRGVYVNRPRIFSSEGSDFDIMPKRRVMNLARATTRTYLEERLNEDILVDATTGFILEEEAIEIEKTGTERLRAALGAEPMASGWSLVLARNDNLLSTKTLTVTTRVIPLAYVEFIEESIGFTNPALRVVTV